MTAESPAQAATPSLRRRMACWLYEGVPLFGIWMIAGLLYGVAFDQRNALIGRHGLFATLCAATGLYFVYFWSHGGQTLPMQTWHIRLVTRAGERVPAWRAALRYLLCWLWFGPALVSLWAAGLTGSTALIFGALAVGVAAYAALAFLHPERQFWHDAVCGTRLVTWLPKPPRQ